MPAEPMRNRGRPRIFEDDVLLEAAFRAFSEHGYDAMSVRTVEAELGLSNGAFNRRFGAKRELFVAAVTYCFTQMLTAVAAEQARRPPPADDLTGLREFIRAFLVVSSRHPEFGRLMNQEGLQRSDRLELIATLFITPFAGVAGDQLRQLAQAGTIRPISTRALFFLVAHGAEAPFTLVGLSSVFDDIDGPLDTEKHIDQMVDFILGAGR